MEAKKLANVMIPIQAFDIDAEGSIAFHDSLAKPSSSQKNIVNFPTPQPKTTPIKGELIISINEEGIVISKNY